jgi:hypothetical protein
MTSAISRHSLRARRVWDNLEDGTAFACWRGARALVTRIHRAPNLSTIAYGLYRFCLSFHEFLRECTSINPDGIEAKSRVVNDAWHSFQNAMTILEDTLAGMRHRDFLACDTPATSLQYYDQSAAVISGCATPLLNHPSYLPGCLIVRKATRCTLQSFISESVTTLLAMLQTRMLVGLKIML